MRVLDILNLNQESSTTMKKSTRKVQSSEAANRQQVLGGAGGAAPSASQSGGGIAAAVDDRASPTVDRGPAGPNVAAVRRTTADDGRRIGRRTKAPRPADGRGALARRQGGLVNLGTSKLKITRPRLRGPVGEVALPGYAGLAGSGELSRRIADVLACNVSTRKYTRVMYRCADEMGISRSAVSRHFVKDSAQALAKLMSRDFEQDRSGGDLR